MHRPGQLGLPLETRQPPRGRIEDRDQPRFEQQRVPLEPQEHLPDDAEGEIEGPEQQEHLSLGDPRDQQQRQGGPAPAAPPPPPPPKGRGGTGGGPAPRWRARAWSRKSRAGRIPCSPTSPVI